MPIGRPGDIYENKNSDYRGAKKQEIQWSLEQPRFHLKDMILDEETYRQIEDVLSFFKNYNKIFLDWGLADKFQAKKGLAVNLYGAPGTGKTMAAHAIADKLQLKMVCVNYADIESKYVGETSKNLTSLFKYAEEHHAVIFFDEADALLSKRVTNMTSATDVSVNQTRSVLLTLLNDYTGIILFATNFIQNFDVAFLRRIAFHIQFHLPNQQVRELLWRSYIPQKMPVNVDYQFLSEKYDGISGSDISTAVFSAAVSAARDHVHVVEQTYFERAIERVLTVRSENSAVQITKRVLTDEEASQIFNQKKE